MRRILWILVGLVLVLPAPAVGTGGDEEGELGAQPARALALQALSILEQGVSHELAMEKLDLALASPDQDDVDVGALRRARAALAGERPERAEELLRRVFPEDDEHLIGVTLRPHRGAPELVAGIIAAAIGALAVLGLVRRRRAERPEDPRSGSGAAAA